MAGGGSSEMKALEARVIGLECALAVVEHEERKLAAIVQDLGALVQDLERQVAGLQGALRGGDVANDATRASGVGPAAPARTGAERRAEIPPVSPLGKGGRKAVK